MIVITIENTLHGTVTLTSKPEVEVDVYAELLNESITIKLSGREYEIKFYDKDGRDEALKSINKQIIDFYEKYYSSGKKFI